MLTSKPDGPTWQVLCYLFIALIPIAYYVVIPCWYPMKWRERFQFWIGCPIYVICGPFMNILVLMYACYYMDSFGWGKTRQVITEDDLLSEAKESSSGKEPQPHAKLD